MNEFCFDNLSKEELKKIINRASEKLKCLEYEEQIGYKPSIKVGEVYLSKSSTRIILRKFYQISNQPDGISSHDALYVSCNGITFEENCNIINKSADSNIQNGLWMKVDNSVYDQAWDSWCEMNDEICALEAKFGSDLLTELNKYSITIIS